MATARYQLLEAAGHSRQLIRPGPAGLNKK